MYTLQARITKNIILAEKAIDLAFNNKEAHLLKTFLLKQQGKDIEALTEINLTLQTNPNDPLLISIKHHLETTINGEPSQSAAT